MLNYIWAGMLIIGFFVAAVNGRIGETAEAAISSADSAIKLSLALLGMMCMWLGVMNIAKKSGLVNHISRFMRPALRVLFPEIDGGHPVLGAMVMNIIANILGLGNAATPLGIKAMRELQSLNKDKDTASNSMCTFLVVNATCIQLFPATVIALRSAAGSAGPTDIIGTVWITSVCAMIAGILSAKFLSRFY